MNLRPLQNALTQNEELPVQTWRFSPSEQGEDLVLWDDIQNMRYRQDGYRQDLFFRGGTSIELEPGDVVTEPAFVEPGETIIQVESLSVTINEINPHIIFVKSNAGRIVVWDPDNQTELINQVIADFSGQHKVDLHTVGKFLYIFDGVTKTYRYIDLEKEEVYTWLNVAPPDLEEPTGGEGGIQVTEGEIEKNVFGFKKGATVIACPLDYLPMDSVDLSKGILQPGVYRYDHNAGKTIIIDGDTIAANTVLTITSTTTFSVGGSGDDPDLWLTSVPLVNGQADMSPLYATIDKIDDSLSPALIYVTSKSDDKKEFYSNNEKCYFLPGSSDIDSYLNTKGPIKSDGETFVSISDYETPSIHRSYTAIYELNDGSFTLPGNPVDINLDADNILYDDGLNYGWNMLGIRVKNTIAASTPANAVKLHLFCTRWQVSNENCYRADDRYPNGTYYHAGEHEPDTELIEDFTPDSELLTPLSSYIPMNAGIYNIFAKDEVEPTHVTSFKNGVLYSNYKINRQGAGTYVSSVDTGTPLPADDELIIQPEYTDNTRGPTATYTGNTGLQFHGVNALITAFHIYWVVDAGLAGETTYFVKRIAPPDPEFFGMIWELDLNGTYPEKEIPAVSAADTTINLKSATVPAFPPQVIDISEQKILQQASAIKGAKIIGFDADRGISVRYRVLFFTDSRPQSGLLTSGQGEQAGTLQLDVEQMDSALPLTTKDSLLQYANGVVFQSTSGIWYTNGASSRKLVDIDKYPELQTPVRDITYNPRWNEIWILCQNNTVISLSSRRGLGRGASPLEGGQRGMANGASLPLITRYTYPIGREMFAITTHKEQIFGSAGAYLLILDDEEATTDAGITTDPQEIIGQITSLPVTPFETQLKIWDIELYGYDIEARVHIDDEEQRFDNFEQIDIDKNEPNQFRSPFSSEYYELFQRGTVIGIHERGISPRIQIETKNKGNGRLIAAQLRGRIIPNTHAVRK